nr:tetratricopeptide repeat protein [Nocardioides thalensis]
MIDIGRWHDARARASQILATSPDDADTHGYLAQACLGQGDFRAAFDAANRLVALRPESDWGHRLVAIALDRLGDHRAALRAIQEAVRLAPHNPNAHIQCALIAADVPGELILAHEAARTGVRLAPNEPDAHFALGVVEHRRNAVAEAEAAYERVLELEPDHAAALNNLTTLRGQWNVSKAIRGYAGALNADPQIGVAQENLDSIATSFPLRLWLASVVALIAAAGFNFADDGVSATTRSIGAMLIVGVCAYTLRVVRQVPRSVRRYVVRRSFRGLALWNWFVFGVVFAATMAVAFTSFGEDVGLKILRPVLTGVVISGVVAVVQRSQSQ